MTAQCHTAHRVSPHQAGRDRERQREGESGQGVREEGERSIPICMCVCVIEILYFFICEDFSFRPWK